MEFAIQKKCQEKKQMNYGIRNEDGLKQKAIEKCKIALEDHEEVIEEAVEDIA